MILNAVVDDHQQFETNATTSSATAKIKKTSNIYLERWNSVFDRLKAYKRTFGNCNVPAKYNDGGTPALGNWVSKQRFEALVYEKTNGEEGQITPDRISKLKSIGFVWELGRQDEWQERWLSMYAELMAFQEKYESTKVPILDNLEKSNGNDDLSSLGRWVKVQRMQHSKLMRNQAAPGMTKERLELLKSINFAWSGKRETDYDKWLHMYFKLLFYYQEHNTTIISDSEGQGSKQLLKWTEQQRTFYRNLNEKTDGSSKKRGRKAVNTLTQHRIDLLEEIDFDWDHCNLDRTWDDMYDELTKYKENFNTTVVSTNINERLGEWTVLQREMYNAGYPDLTQEQIQKLNKIDFDWNFTVDVNWNAMMYRLDAYNRKHDTTIVPNHDGGDRPLANWVNNQRVKLGKYVLNDEGEYYDDHDLVERIASDLGCSPDETFEPKGFIKRLTPSTLATRIRRLNAIGFVWDAQEASWQEQYQRLLVYKDENNGSTMVPFLAQDGNSSGEQTTESLGVWVKIQRQKKQDGELSEKRLQLLEKIDFVWDPQNDQWNEMFDQLCLYRKQHNGSTSVPRGYPDLGNWVNTQRRTYKRKTLPTERIERLNSIGFLWEESRN